MSLPNSSAQAEPHCLANAVDRAARAIPPLWPLASSVAVNPFLGQTSESLAQAGARLARVAGITVTMPRSWYRDKIASGEIADADLAGALANAPAGLRPSSLAALKAAAKLDAPPSPALPTIADLAAEVSGIDWPRLIEERFGAWAAGYFDEGQALWAAPRGKGAYVAWRAIASHDLTPEIAGLSGFARHMSDAPETAMAVIERVVDRIGFSADAIETYFHQMLMTLGGWSQYARYKLWQAELGGGSDETIVDFIAIRLLWEEALFIRHGAQIADRWTLVRASHALAIEATPDLVIDTILQEAMERSAQLALAKALARPNLPSSAHRPLLQAAFCIDVRSEVFRRALESVSDKIQTLGFAGFFGITASHRRSASDLEELRLPVLLNVAVKTCAGGADSIDADKSARIQARARRAWGRFKLAAVSSFALVEATGPVYAGKLASDALGLSGPSALKEPAPRFDPPLDLATRTTTAETILRAMSLTGGFAPIVLLVGHGATVANNPHASGLQCGACGGCEA